MIPEISAHENWNDCSISAGSLSFTLWLLKNQPKSIFAVVLDQAAKTEGLVSSANLVIDKTVV